MAIRYENAPISEALIDIRVEASPDANIGVLDSLHQLVMSEYPRKDQRLFVQGQFSVGNEVGASTRQTPIGFAFTSEDGKQIFQARLDGFTFSRLRPYGTWMELRAEAKRLWRIYCESVKPVKVIRTAVRYINQIDIPFQVIDYKDFFRTTPEVSPDLPQGLGGFFMQLQFPLDDIEGVMILTETAIPPANPGINSVILDLDVFRNESDTITGEALWQTLDKLRDKKNAFFEGCITDKTRSLFGRKEEY